MSAFNPIPEPVRRLFSTVTPADFPQARSLWARIVPKSFSKMLDEIGFSWNRETQAWRDARGMAVNSHKLATEFVSGVQNEMRSLAGEAKITVRRWFHAGATRIKGERIALGALAAGGFKRLTQPIIETVVGERETPGPGLAYTIDRMGDMAETAPEMSEAQIGSMSERDASAGWGSYEEVRREVAKQAGMTMEYNRLDDEAHHCKPTATTVSCEELTAMQWQPFGSMPLPGSPARSCFLGCRCSMAYQ